MPGDSVEMVCDLVHEAAAEVGTRFTLREGGKTGKYFYPIIPTCNPHGHSQLEPALSQSFFRQLRSLASYWPPPRFIPPVIHVRVRYKSYYLSLLMLSSPVLYHSPLTTSRNIGSYAYLHTYVTPGPNYLCFARDVILVNPRRTAVLVGPSATMENTFSRFFHILAFPLISGQYADPLSY